MAKAAGVSAATVSKVLNGVGTVRAENAARVQEAVSQLGYRLDPLASGLRTEQRRIIGAIVPDFESSFFGALVTGLERAAEAAGYAMIVASARESEAREAELVARMGDWRVSGTVLIPVRSETGAGAAQLEAMGMAAVLVDRVSAHPRFDTVTADSAAACEAVADYLLAAGHRHILVLGGTAVSKAVRIRDAAFAARIAAQAPKTVVDRRLTEAPGAEAQRGTLSAYFEDGARPTAIFALSQQATLVTLAELRRRDLPVPGEIALVGFDDADWMQTTWPAITAVAQPVAAMAERAVNTLLARVEGRQTGPAAEHREPCEMRIRQSTGSDQAIPPRAVGQD